jgi:hypothetical protein
VNDQHVCSADTDLSVDGIVLRGGQSDVVLQLPSGPAHGRPR